MAMGIVSDKDFDSELSGLNKDKESKSTPTVPITTGEVIDAPTKGRGTNPEVPEGLRKLIGTESAINGRQSGIELAQSFGISASSVSAYGVGANSTASYDERPNESHISNAKQRVATRARKKLVSAIHHITKDKLEAANAKDLAGIAKDMAAVIKVMEPEPPKAPSNDSGPKFIFYSPQFKNENNYDVVVAKE